MAYLKVFGKSGSNSAGRNLVGCCLQTAKQSLCVSGRQGVGYLHCGCGAARGSTRKTVTVRTAEFIRELEYLKRVRIRVYQAYVRFLQVISSRWMPGGKFRTGIQVSGRGSLFSA